MKHEKTESLIDMIQTQVHIEDRHLFRMMIYFYYGAMAGTHGVYVESENFGEIPVNFYGVPLAPSGFGKNLTSNLIKEYVFNPFYQSFLDNTFSIAKEERFREMLPLYAKAMAKAGSITPPTDDELFEAMEEDLSMNGTFINFFEDITPAAIRQLSAHIQMTNANALNLVVDEIGSSLKDIKPSLTSFLKLYDVGLDTAKVLKNYKDSQRAIDLPYRIPANLLLFGEPDMLLNGGDNQNEFMSLLNTGFGRRCFFNIVEKKPPISKTAEELYEIAAKSREFFHNTEYWQELGEHKYHNKKIKLNKDQALKILEYRIECSKRALDFKSYEKILSTELEHRYFKVMKLAGNLAYVDKLDHITDEHINIAIDFAERSGEDLVKIVNRPDNYEHVLRYLEENHGEKLTRADIHKNVMCFRGSVSNQNNLLDLAMAMGYSKNTIVSKSNINGVEFFTANVLIPTDIDQLIISASGSLADNFIPKRTSFDNLTKFVTSTDNVGFCNHHFVNNHRKKDMTIEGFNMVVLDVDGTSTIGAVVSALKPFKFIIYKTKSHTEDEHRFRIILPLSHEIKLSTEDFSKYMENLFAFLPFKVDEATKDTSRRWATKKGEPIVNGGEDTTLLPASWFIPDTRDSETIIKDLSKYGNNGIVRYFATTSKYGVNRNNNLYRYARFLIDSGYKKFEEVIDKVRDLNKGLEHPISEEELNSTVFKSIATLFD